MKDQLERRYERPVLASTSNVYAGPNKAALCTQPLRKNSKNNPAIIFFKIITLLLNPKYL